MVLGPLLVALGCDPLSTAATSAFAVLVTATSGLAQVTELSARRFSARQFSARQFSARPSPHAATAPLPAVRCSVPGGRGLRRR